MESLTQDVLHNIVTNYSKKFQDIPITLILRDSNQKEYVIVNKGKYKSSKYTIVLSSHNNTSFRDSGNTYFASNVKELYQIIDYINMQPELFILSHTEDVLDNCEIIPLNEDEF